MEEGTIRVMTTGLDPSKAIVIDPEDADSFHP
jgi:hypothetical protein